MFTKAITVGVAVLLGAAPAAAQQRGTVELGAFGSATSFGSSLNMRSGWGGGARVGAFFTPRFAIELEGGGIRAGRALGLADVNVGVIAARLTVTPLQVGRLSVLLGAGATHTDTYFIESYGPHGLLGAKLRLTPNVDLRIDGILDYMANQGHTYGGLHAGLSFYRQPRSLTRTVTVAGPSVVARPDPAIAAEHRRLQNVAADYRALRDSLARPSVPRAASSPAALATMREMIHFAHDQSELSDSAKAILNDKVTVFNANPAMRIVIVGFASQPGTEAYNMALGTRRAEAAKAYLVSQGVDPIRIEIATRGEGQLVVEGPGELADAENRRGQFRLLIADPYLAVPKK
jgi:peptidoglycan-associated lipoprotein